MVFPHIVKLCLRLWAASIITAYVRKHNFQLSLSDEDIERGNKKREMDQMRMQYIKEKGYSFFEMWDCEWWNL